MPTRTVRVQDVTQKTTAKGDIYELVDGDKNRYATFKRDVAEAARTLKGNEAEIEYSEVQKGDYLNLWLDSILPLRTEPSANGFTQVTQPAAGEMSPAREMRIMRQSAAKVAVEQLRYLLPAEQTVATLRELTDWWVDYFLNGWDDVQPPALAQPAAAAPAAAADDIPF